MVRYEAHMTFDQKHAAMIEEESYRLGWVFSVITGCPILGTGTYCYLTNYVADAPQLLLGAMAAISKEFEARGITTLRAKIEHIVYDSKTGVNELAA